MSADVSSDLLFQYWTKRQTHCGRSKGLGKYLCPVSLRLSLLLLSFWHSLLLCCQFERRFDQLPVLVGNQICQDLA
jgi:hypothetical protein